MAGVWREGEMLVDSTAVKDVCQVAGAWLGGSSGSISIIEGAE